jgi:hypothetical protein
MTHRHNDFECLSLKDCVDTMSWLAYKQRLFDTLSKVRFLPEGDVPRLWYFACYHSATSQHEYLTSSWFDNTSMLRARGLCNLTTTSTTLSCSAIASMTRQHCHHLDSVSTSRHGLVASIALSPAWLSSTVASMIYITSQSSHLYSAIASMTRQHYRYMTQHLHRTVT